MGDGFGLIGRVIGWVGDGIGLVEREIDRVGSWVPEPRPASVWSGLREPLGTPPTSWAEKACWVNMGVGKLRGKVGSGQGLEASVGVWVGLACLVRIVAGVRFGFAGMSRLVPSGNASLFRRRGGRGLCGEWAWTGVGGGDWRPPRDRKRDATPRWE